MLAAKTSLAVRYDALGEDVDTEMGIENRAKLESRIRFFEEGGVSVLLYYFIYFQLNSLYLLVSILTVTEKVAKSVTKRVYPGFYKLPFLSF